MISKKLADALNQQMTNEYLSSYRYLQMSLYLKNENLDGSAYWMKLQSDEETEHAEKIRDFLSQLGHYPKLGELEAPKADYTSLEEVLHQSLTFEKEVTAAIYELYELALEEKHIPTQLLLQWFIQEQVEEEDKFQTLIDRYDYYKADHVALFDAEMGRHLPE